MFERLGVVAAIASFVAAAGAVHAADESDAERVTVAASERYRAGRVHRFALGGGYRDLWMAPVLLPVLDLETRSGGLEPVGRFGGLQTAVLALRDADGRSYTFRGTDKDPSAVLDPLLYDTVVQSLVQDQMAAQHPGGPLAAGVLTEAAGVLTVRERMVVMPDDPRLGEYREEFAGMVGTFFEYPQPAKDGRPGFAGATEILDHEELYAALAEGDTLRVDVRAFLRARLLDIFLGDFDRHRKQWRWARVPGQEMLQPIPEDRDMAFVRYDGFAQRVARIYVPILQEYDEDYPFSIKGLTLHGWEQDRWLLPQLSWEDWEPIIADIQSRLTDDVIERAIAALPPEYAALDGERMRRDVRGRRDQLPQAARRFYEHLAHRVDVQTSDATNRVDVDRDEEGRTRVVVRPSAGDGPPLFDREFLPGETGEIRLYLREGDDQVVVRGRSCCIRLRVIAGPGRKRVDDSAGGGTRIYDETESVEVEHGSWTRVDRRPYLPPPPDSGFVDVEEVPPRDWGSDTIPLPEFGFEPDVGAFIGAAVAHTRYGFRKHPWSSKHSLGFGWATEPSEPRTRYQGLFRPENSKLVTEVDIAYSGIEVLRFYGLGNDTDDDVSDSFYRTRNQQARARARLRVPFEVLGQEITVAGGPFVQWSRTKNGSRQVDLSADAGDIIGTGKFGIFGAEMNLQIDTRKSLAPLGRNLELPFFENPAAGYPTSGIFFDFTARMVPSLWSNNELYGWIDGSIAGYVSVGERARATLGVRIGGRETFGDPPYFDLATVGGGRFFTGSANNRGFRAQRFTGESSLYGNADLRIFLARFKVVVPTDFGIHGFADAGRVFVGGESSDDWHPSGGGGVWFSPLVRTNTISFSIAKSGEETMAYLRIGFHY